MLSPAPQALARAPECGIVICMKIAALLLLLVLAGCKAKPDFDPYRTTIRDRLRDPASAEFKDEAIRTLWSKDGSRYKLYCAMVNANNAFGGKSGFRPATVVISVINKRPDPYGMVKSVYVPGKAFLDDAVSPDFYLNCQRSDTERKPGSLFMTWPTFGRTWNNSYRAEVDRDMPILSNEVAPEQR